MSMALGEEGRHLLQRAGHAAAIAEKIRTIALDDIEKLPEVALGSDVGCVAGRERGAVEGEAEHPDASAKQSFGEPFELGEDDTFGTEANPLQQSQPREEAGDP